MTTVRAEHAAHRGRHATAFSIVTHGVGEPLRRTRDERSLLGDQIHELGVYAIETLPHGSGLRLTTTLANIDSVNSSPLVEEVRQLLSDEAQASDNFVEVVAGDPYQFTSRIHDVSPFWSGARMRPKSADDICTSGFAAGNLFHRAMLTAAHCFLDDDVETESGTAGPAGVSAGHVSLNRSFDVARVDIWLDRSNRGKMYDGVLGNESVRPVKGKGPSYSGLLLCVSGSFSGTVCNVQVVSVGNIIDEFFSAQRISGLVFADQLEGAGAVGSRDSGAPVFSLNADLIGVKARGIAVAGQAGGGVAPCAGETHINGSSRFCSSRLVYAEIDNALTLNGVWLELDP